jgi:Family of unknown function (DUF6496)
VATKKTSTKAQKKVKKVMHEYKRGELHTGSKKGPKVKSRKQAVAIALSEARKSGAKVPPKKAGKKTAVKKATKKTGSKRW